MTAWSLPALVVAEAGATGLRAEIGLLQESRDLLFTLLIIGVATASKLGGAVRWPPAGAASMDARPCNSAP